MRYRKIKVKAHRVLKKGKWHNVKAYTKVVKDDRVTVTKKQYEARAKKKSLKVQKADNTRRKRNALCGTTNKLKPGWNTKRTDWEGVDAPAYPKIKKEQVIKRLTGQLPKGYKIVKYWRYAANKKNKVTRYRPTFQNKPIGGVRPYLKLKTAQKICNTHNGRRTGTIRNRSQEGELLRKGRSYREDYAGPAWKDPKQTDYVIDWEAEDDSSLSYSERMAERKRKKRTGYGAMDY